MTAMDVAAHIGELLAAAADTRQPGPCDSALPAASSPAPIAVWVAMHGAVGLGTALPCSRWPEAAGFVRQIVPSPARVTV
jgi:hypothetical protein